MQIKRTVYLLMTIFSLASLLVGGFAVYVMYLTAFEEEGQRLQQIVQSQARLMEAVARFDRQYSRDYPGGTEAATLSQVREAHAQYKSFGETGEFHLAKQVGDKIVLLHQHQKQGHKVPAHLSNHYEQSTPMRLALQGKSGVTTAIDYRGVEVLAAYEPVDILNLGIVAKTDMAEVRAGYIKAFVYAAVIGLLVVGLGTQALLRTVMPWTRALQESEESFRLLLNSTAEGILGIDENGKCSFANPAAIRMLGYDSAEELCMLPFLQVSGEEHPALRAIHESRKVHSTEGSFLRRDNTRFPVEYWAYPVEGREQGSNTVVTFVDITERKQLEQELQRMATYDMLTGVYNRQSLEKAASTEVERALRYGHPLSVLVIDIDHFKSVNDTRGHAGGDSVLRAFAQLLSAHTRQPDTVARYGGEEFVVLLPELDLENALQLAERLRDKIAQTPMTIDGASRLHITVSIGVATLPNHGEDFGSLFKAADRALYQAKFDGRNRVKAA